MGEIDYASRLKADPGDPIFVDHAENLRTERRLEESLLVLLRGLSKNPSQHKGRLLLARIFWELGFTPFSINELEILARKLPEQRSVKKLLDKLAPGLESKSQPDLKEETVAEAEFAFDELELIESEKQ